MLLSKILVDKMVASPLVDLMDLVDLVNQMVASLLAGKWLPRLPLGIMQGATLDEEVIIRELTTSLPQLYQPWHPVLLICATTTLSNQVLQHTPDWRDLQF